MFITPQPGAGGDLEPVSIPNVIPLFPLPNVVFFPRTYLPLHVFETRYRRMVMDAAESHRMIGIVLLKEGWESDYEGTPPIFPIGCVGRMITIQSLPDGRFNILLQGLCRFEVGGEMGSEEYRQGLIDLKEFERPEGGLPPGLRAEMLRMVAVVLKGRDEGLALSTLLKQPLPDESLVHNLSLALDFTPLEKQFLLESDSLVQQARRLLDLLQFKQYERNDATGWG
jgi:hypothetical protein